MPGTSNSGGRNAKSAARHAVSGTFRGDRHGDGAVAGAEGPKGVPTPPKPLEGDALEEWNRTVQRLQQLGTLSTVDDAAIYQYACLFAATEATAVLQLEVAGSALVVEENIGDLKGAELVQAFQEITKLRALEARYASQIRQGRMGIRTWLVEMGLTPSARNRVKGPAAPPKSDPLMALVSRRNAG